MPYYRINFKKEKIILSDLCFIKLNAAFYWADY